VTAPVSTTEPLQDWEYELLAGADTAEGYTAWNAGDYAAAVRLWKSAALLSQAADKATKGGVSL